MKDRLARARLVALALVIVAAVCGTAAAAVAAPVPVAARVLAGLAALASALIPVLRPGWSGRALKNWARARSVSEALKTEVYTALAKPGMPESGIQDRVDRLLLDAADLGPELTGVEAVARSLPEVHDGSSYFAIRVAGQIDGYYALRAAHLRRKLRRFRAAEGALGVVGALLGGVAAVAVTSLAAWIAVVATVGTALTTHVAASRYEYQEIEFLRTAERLRCLRDRAARPGANLDALVDLAEDAISVENQAWMAKVSEGPPEQRRPT